MVIFGTLHLVALTLGLALFVMFLRSGSRSGFKPPEEDEGGGGGNDRVSDKPKNSPSGGIPLPDAEPSSRRLRSHERLADTAATLQPEAGLRPRPACAPPRRDLARQPSPQPDVLARVRLRLEAPDGDEQAGHAPGCDHREVAPAKPLPVVCGTKHASKAWTRW